MSDNKHTTGAIVNNYKAGMIALLSCTVLWGFLPLYWQALRPIESKVIIFYRIVLVGVCCFFVALKLFGFEGIKAPLRVKGVKMRYFLAGALITLNWSIFIWAVNADHVIQTAIGYYIEPLVICLFGVCIFKEKLNIHKKIAIILALIGVIVVLVYFRQIPAIALSLAVTFAVYAAVKKRYDMPPMLSLFYETMFLMPFAFAVIIYLEVTGQGAIGVGETYQYFLLLLCGIATAIPLGLFAFAANNVSLVTLGVAEYIAPSITLLIGIFVMKEPFDIVQLIAFIIIWIGLSFFTYGEIKDSKKAKAKEKLEATERAVDK